MTIGGRNQKPIYWVVNVHRCPVLGLPCSSFCFVSYWSSYLPQRPVVILIYLTCNGNWMCPFRNTSGDHYCADTSQLWKWFMSFSDGKANLLKNIKLEDFITSQNRRIIRFNGKLLGACCSWKHVQIVFVLVSAVHYVTLQQLRASHS